MGDEVTDRTCPLYGAGTCSQGDWDPYDCYDCTPDESLEYDEDYIECTPVPCTEE